MSGARPSLAEYIDAIESSYEFMLAYAAQGRDFESVGGDGPSIRKVLKELREALALVGGAFEGQAALAGAEARARFLDFCRLLKSDAERALMAVDLVLAVENISSQLVDNLNASLHLRALLTDMFLIDEATKTLSNKVQH